MARVAEDGGDVRKRKRRKRKIDAEQEGESSKRPSDSIPSVSSTEKANKPRAVPERPTAIQSGSYWLTRIVFIRALGFVYCNSLLPRRRRRRIFNALRLSPCSRGVLGRSQPEQGAAGQERSPAHPHIPLWLEELPSGKQNSKTFKNKIFHFFPLFFWVLGIVC